MFHRDANPPPPHPTSCPRTRVWGIFRVVLLIALGILFAGTNVAIDQWKRRVTGEMRGNIDDGDMMYSLPHDSFRDYSHRGLQHATDYFQQHHNRALVLSRCRDIFILIQGILILILTYRHHGFGCRFIIEYGALIVTRQFAVMMVWTPIARNAVLLNLLSSATPLQTATDHFFSGHVSTTLLCTTELIRASHPYRVMIRVLWGMFWYGISLYVTLAQLMLRVHYFSDIFCAIFVIYTICAGYHLLELHHHIPVCLVDQDVDGHDKSHDTHEPTRHWLPNFQDQQGHMQFDDAMDQPGAPPSNIDVPPTYHLPHNLSLRPPAHGPPPNMADMV